MSLLNWNVEIVDKVAKHLEDLSKKLIFQSGIRSKLKNNHHFGKNGFPPRMLGLECSITLVSVQLFGCDAAPVLPPSPSENQRRL